MIVGEKIKLRAIERGDLKKLHEWYNDSEVNLLANYTPHSAISLAELEKGFEKRIEEKRDDRGLYIIETKKGKTIGTVDYRDLSRRHHRAHVGIIIGDKEYWDKGYGTDAMRTFLDVLFNQMNLHRVTMRTLSYNERAKKSAEKLGFKVEGILKEDIFVNGKYYDRIFMGLLKDEFRRFNR